MLTQTSMFLVSRTPVRTDRDNRMCYPGADSAHGSHVTLGPLTLESSMRNPCQKSGREYERGQVGHSGSAVVTPSR